MAKISNNAIVAMTMSVIAVVTSFINVLNWFFWIFTILGVYFAVKAVLNGEKKFGWIAIGIALLSIVTYSIVRTWTPGRDTEVEDESEQDRREYQRAIDNANYYDVTEDPSETTQKVEKKEEKAIEEVDETEQNDVVTDEHSDEDETLSDESSETEAE